MTDPPEGRMRLDKWLWAARFFKTRDEAATAVTGGQVHLSGQRTKPGREIRIGSRLQIRRDGLDWDVEVCALPAQRRPAAQTSTAAASCDGFANSATDGHGPGCVPPHLP